MLLLLSLSQAKLMNITQTIAAEVNATAAQVQAAVALLYGGCPLSTSHAADE